MGTPIRTYAGALANATNVVTEGIYFTVNSTISVDALGIFSPSAASPPSGVTMTVRLANRSTSTTIIASTTFTNASPGTADAANSILYKSITPVELVPGNYCVWEDVRPVIFQMHVYPGTGAGSQPTDSTLSGAISISGSYYHTSSTTLMPNTFAGAGVYYGGPTLYATSSSTAVAYSKVGVSSIGIGF